MGKRVFMTIKFGIEFDQKPNFPKLNDTSHLGLSTVDIMPLLIKYCSLYSLALNY